MKLKKITIITFLALTLFAGVGSAQDETKGTIAGDIRLSGKIPKWSDPAIVEYQGPCGTKRPTSIVRLWKNRIMDVTLWLTPADENDKSGLDQILTDEIKVTSIRCEFVPKLIVARPSSIVNVSNDDPYTQWLIIEEDGEKKRQVLQESNSDPIDLTVKNDTSIHLTSGFYPWMEAWIKSIDNLLYSTATDWDGRFFFKDILPGTYILHAWHASLGEVSQTISVAADEKTSIEVNFEMPQKTVPVIEASSLEELFGRPDDVDDNPFKK